VQGCVLVVGAGPPLLLLQERQEERRLLALPSSRHTNLIEDLMKIEVPSRSLLWILEFRIRIDLITDVDLDPAFSVNTDPDPRFVNIKMKREKKLKKKTKLV